MYWPPPSWGGVYSHGVTVPVRSAASTSLRRAWSATTSGVEGVHVPVALDPRAQLLDRHRPVGVQRQVDPLLRIGGEVVELVGVDRASGRTSGRHGGS